MKVALYARVSSERQAEKDLSIPAQLKALRNHALRHGWEIVQEFVDEAESARTANRPAFQEMIASAKQKQAPFSAILVWKLSRFARSREDSIMYKTLLRKKGVQVVSINEQIDDSPTGRLLEGMIESMDEFYSANLAQDTRRGMKENAQRGFLNGARPPHGYRTEINGADGTKRRVMVINEAEAPAVRKAFELCQQGEGVMEIAKTLSAQGFQTRSGARWKKTAVRYILRNETYAGTYVWNRLRSENGAQLANPISEVVRVENHHSPIVDQNTFDKVQRLLTQRAPKVTNPRVVGSSHLLSGLLFCEHCGTRMIAAGAKSGRFTYYGCQRKLKEGKESCSQRSLNARKIEPCIVGVIKDRLLTEEHLSELVRMICEECQSTETEACDKVTTVSAQLDDVEKKLRRYFDLIESESIPISDVSARLRELNLKKESLLAEKAKLNAPVRHVPVLTPTRAIVRAYVEDLSNTLREGTIMHRKAFLRSFIKRIGIRGNEAEIEYTCPIGLSGDRKREVLSTGQNGDPAAPESRTFKIRCHHSVRGQGKPYAAELLADP